MWWQTFQVVRGLFGWECTRECHGVLVRGKRKEWGIGVRQRKDGEGSAGHIQGGLLTLTAMTKVCTVREGFEERVWKWKRLASDSLSGLDWSVNAGTRRKSGIQVTLGRWANHLIIGEALERHQTVSEWRLHRQIHLDKELKGGAASKEKYQFLCIYPMRKGGISV